MREYYVNDAGAQIGRFADSLAARLAGEEPPEGGYGGAYVGELAERLAAEGLDGSDREALGRRGVELMMEEVRATLVRFGVQIESSAPSGRSTSAARSSCRWPTWRRPGTPTAAKTRSGCGRRPSATTRTGS